MAIISRAEGKKRRLFSSIRTKIMLTYLIYILIVMAILNIYPISILRDIVFTSKQTTLQNQAAQIGTSLEVLESLTKDAAEQVIKMLDVNSRLIILVVDPEGDTIYFTSRGDNFPSSEKNAEMIINALDGRDEFYSSFSDGVFESYASVPIMYNGNVVGAVSVYEYDETEGTILVRLQRNIVQLSAAMSAVAIFISIIFSHTLTRRIRKVLAAIKSVREGEYTYRITKMRGNDELVQLGNEFNSLTDRLQSTEEIRRRFVADASHELKTPLASIRLLSDSILQTEGMDTETINEFVLDIRNEAERLARTTEKLLELTHLDNNITTIRTSVDCAAVAANVLRMARPLAEEKNISLEENFEEDCTVLSTEDDIYGIIFNLTENAIKYNNPGGRVRIKIVKEKGNVIISVADTGVGIPQNDLPYIFDRFYRVDKARSREQGGSGLGLSIVKSTVERHGGEVRAEHNYKEGMTFKAIFPGHWQR